MNYRRVLVIAGPNGAGETTFAQAFVLKKVHCPRFSNADLIAAGLSPCAPIAWPSACVTVATISSLWLFGDVLLRVASSSSVRSLRGR